jgi:DegV family protein with EDD domain
MNIGILTDSLSDLPYTFCNEHNIRMISSYVNKGGTSAIRDDKMNKAAFYKHIYSIEPKTHSPSQRDFSSVYASMSDEYDVIFSLHSSLSLTSIYLKASKVAQTQTFGNTKIYVYDTGQISGGLGVIVRAVSMMIESGATPDEINAEIPNLLIKTKFACIIPSDKLIGNSENLNRNNLKLKTNSILTLNRGMVVMGKTTRKMFKSVEIIQQRVMEAEPRLIQVSHSITPKENFNKKTTYPYFLWGDVPEDIHNQFIGEGFDSILNVMNPSLISHMGMGTMGVGSLVN